MSYLSSINKLNNGKRARISMSEIVNGLISLIDAKLDLPPDQFKQVRRLYGVYDLDKKEVIK